MVDDLDEGSGRGRIALRTGLILVGILVALIATGYVGAHLDAGAGDRAWTSRLAMLVPAAVILAVLLALVIKLTRVPKGASEGVRKEALVRRRFWGWNGAGAAFGVVTVVWLQSSTPGTSLFSGGELPATPAIVLALAYLVGGLWAGFVWYIRMDEVEKADNLWAGSIATTAVLLIYPAWFLLSRARLIAEPAHWAPYVLLLVTYGAVYLGRKARR